MVTRGFGGRQPPQDVAGRLPPGQFLTEDFPVLSAGPNPRVSLDDWKFTLKLRAKPVAEWSWAEFNALPQSKMTRDIHCVTAWSKFDTAWQGVLVDDILAEAGIEPPTAVRARPFLRRLHHQRADRRPHRRQGDGRAEI